jgi:protein-S-isoprenylcysteine O-methyltransferase Ste14
MLRATDFEFRHRFWFIGGIFFLGFSSYSFDHQNLVLVVAKFFLAEKLRVDPSATGRALHLIFAFAALLAVLAAALRTWAAAYLSSAIVHDHPLHAENLVADGPFRWMRNPLYDGGILLGAGMGLLASPVGWCIITFGLPLFYFRLVLREEAALLATQGESFRAYCAAVPRFLPWLRPRVKASGATPRWGQAFAGEIFMWGFAASVISFAVTLEMKVFYILLDVSLLGYAIYWISRRRAENQKRVAMP